MSYVYRELTDKDEIATRLRADPYRHLYELGDLEAPHWPRTTWFAADRNGALDAVFMLYMVETWDALPVFLAMGGSAEAGRWLLEQVRPKLPKKLYVHASMDHTDACQELFRTSGFEPHLRMRLDALRSAPTPPGIVLRRLARQDLALLESFYAASMTGNWFTPEMLEHGVYVGAFEGAELVAAAGTHIYSPAQGLAALGNVATMPSRRSRGLAAAASAAVCRELAATCPTIGLNVRTDNLAAVRCYEKLGFTVACRFAEFYADL